MNRIINKAREVLAAQDITSFNIDVTTLKLTQTVFFDTFGNYARTVGIPVAVFGKIGDGCTVIKDDVYIILTHGVPPVRLHRSNCSHTEFRNKSGRHNWTLAHEVAHVCLGHVSDGEEEERQADCFSGELLMPELVILELQRRLGRRLQACEISRMFGVSGSAAENRARQIAGKRFFSAYLKRELMEKYGRLIGEYVEKNKVKSWQTVIL